MLGLGLDGGRRTENQLVALKECIQMGINGTVNTK